MKENEKSWQLQFLDLIWKELRSAFRELDMNNILFSSYGTYFNLNVMSHNVLHYHTQCWATLPCSNSYSSHSAWAQSIQGWKINYWRAFSPNFIDPLDWQASCSSLTRPCFDRPIRSSVCLWVSVSVSVSVSVCVCVFINASIHALHCTQKW